MFDEQNMRHPTRISIGIEKFYVEWSNRIVGPEKNELLENASIFFRRDLGVIHMLRSHKNRQN